MGLSIREPARWTGPPARALPGREVFVRRVGNAGLLVPMDDPWTAFEAALAALSDDSMTERVQPAVEQRESL